MQTQVHTYAAHEISGERGHLGYVLRGCRNGPKKLSLVTATDVCRLIGMSLCALGLSRVICLLIYFGF